MRTVMRTFVVLGLCLAVAGCGKKKKEGGGAEGGGGGGGGGGTTTCTEKNELTIVWGENEKGKPADGKFEIKGDVGFVTGMVWNGNEVAKSVQIALANYPVTLGMYMIDLPKDPGQVALLFKFEPKGTPVTDPAKQKEVYATLSVPTGDYSFDGANGNTIGGGIWVTGETGAPNIANSGTAKLTTAAADRACGSLDLTSPSGTTIKGTFNVAITKDLWK